MKNTSARWAKSIDMPKQEFNEYLRKLGLQEKACNSNRWRVTKKGKEHSSNRLGMIYWDVQALFEVIKLRGKITHDYFFCDECNTYHKIDTEDKERKSHICSSCGADTVML